MARLRAKLVTFGLALLLVPVLVLLGELGVRLFATPIDPLSIFIASPQLRSDTQGENTAGMFEFDPLLTWRLKANLRGVWWDFTPVSTNGSHLRMDRELGSKRGLRVVCMGDSVTFGYRVPVAHDRTSPHAFDASEKTYPQLLEAALRAAHPGREIEVIPLACPGYTSRQGLEWLRRDISDLQPDIVTACYGWNDVRAAGLPDRLTQPTGAAVQVRHLMSHSQLLLQIGRSAQQKKRIKVAPEPRSNEAEFVGHFAQMADLSRQHGAWFGIILPVYRDRNTPGEYPEGRDDIADPEEGARITRYRKGLIQSAAANKIPSIEISELTETGWPENADLFGERIHPNAAGHALMAARLLPWLGPEVAKRVK